MQALFDRHYSDEHMARRRNFRRRIIAVVVALEFTGTVATPRQRREIELAEGGFVLFKLVVSWLCRGCDGCVDMQVAQLDDVWASDWR